MTIYQKLLEVQTKLKAPKSQYNSFGKYAYRNAEDILESVKPHCAEVGACIILTDKIVMLGDRYYIESTAKFIDIASGEQIEVSANAREEQDKKGMDGSQITGSSSSYARKYALNGLLCIDDTKDSDTTNKGEDKNPIKKDEPKQTEPKKMDYETASAMKMKLPMGDVKIDHLNDKQIQRALKDENFKQYHEALKVVLEFRQNQPFVGIENVDERED